MQAPQSELVPDGTLLHPTKPGVDRSGSVDPHNRKSCPATPSISNLIPLSGRLLYGSMENVPMPGITNTVLISA